MTITICSIVVKGIDDAILKRFQRIIETGQTYGRTRRCHNFIQS